MSNSKDEIENAIRQVFIQYLTNIVKLEYSRERLIDEILVAYNSKDRYFHNIDHVYNMLQFMFNNIQDPQSLKIAILAVLYHDIIYDVESEHNEFNSGQFMKERFNNVKEVQIAYDIILDTKSRVIKDDLFKLFHIADFGALYNGNIVECMDSSYLIFKEYQRFDYLDYVRERCNFLKNSEYVNNNIRESLIELTRCMIPRIGIYAGSFDPFHIGHYNILEQAEKIFDKVIIVFAQNTDKKNHLPKIPEILKNRQIVILKRGELLTDYIKYINTYSSSTLIRGLRNGDDLNYEMNQLRFMTDMYPELKTINIICDAQYTHISSSTLRGLLKINYDISSYLP